MSEQPLSVPVPEVEKIVDDEEKRRLILRGFTAEQAQDIAQMQLQRVVVVTSNVLTVSVTVLVSALSLVAALAWNTLITHWLPTVPLFDSRDILKKELAYAIFSTLLAVFVIILLGIINTRRSKRETKL